VIPMKPNRTIFLIVLLAFVVGVPSCATFRVKDQGELTDRLNAEVSLLKKRLTRLEREHKVCSEENLQYKKDLASERQRIENLDQALDALKEKAQLDAEELEGRIEALVGEKEVLQQRCDEKIRELSVHNEDTERKARDEATRLKWEILRQKALFDAERRELSEQKDRIESESTKRAEALNQKIASLTRSLEERSNRLEEALDGVEAGEKKIALLEQEIRELQGRLEALKSPQPSGETTN